MELYLVDCDYDKVKGMRSWWHGAVVLVGLLLALNVAAFLTELSQGILASYNSDSDQDLHV